MIPELGHFALITALCVAIILSILPLVGVRFQLVTWMSLARPAALAQFLLISISFLCLTYAFITHDFSVLYVANTSNSELPLIYRITGVWGAHEGSLLVWVLILSMWTAAAAVFSRNIPLDMIARVLAILGMVNIGFLLFILLTSNPFDRIFPVPADGRSLNPLLQDFGLIVHPPMLYMGYVGFSVAFAFAIAALLSGRLDSAWARWMRPWTNTAWLFLTLGITLGSWWAYYELGWGGWWFWDPVENASFMPWLVGTALIHTLSVTEKRSVFKSWTILLAIFAFSLSLLGTFLVRSGVLTSVHAFASDPTRGLFILLFLCFVVGGSLLLYSIKAPRLVSTGEFKLFSRESALLANNVLLIALCGTVLLGTLYPLAIDALGAGKISVGPPYFNSVFIPLAIPLFVLMGLGPLVRWRQDRFSRLLKQLLTTALATAVITVFIALVWEKYEPLSLLGLAVGLWMILSALRGLHDRIKTRPDKLRALRGINSAFWGMSLAHIGVAVVTIGISITSFYSIEKDLRMSPGDTYKMGSYQFTFEGASPVRGENYTAMRGTVVAQSGSEALYLYPEKRTYNAQGNVMTEAAISPGFTRDLYVALGEPLNQGAWSVRIYYKPLVRWLWLGGVLMAIGGLLAAMDRRYRPVRQYAAAPETGLNAKQGAAS